MWQAVKTIVNKGENKSNSLAQKENNKVDTVSPAAKKTQLPVAI